SSGVTTLSKQLTAKSATKLRFIAFLLWKIDLNLKPASRTKSRSVVLAKEIRSLFAADPLEGPAALPWFGIRAEIVNGDFIFQRIHVGAREALDQMELFGVRKAAVVDPELFVEALEVLDECRAFLQERGSAGVPPISRLVGRGRTQPGMTVGPARRGLGGRSALRRRSTVISDEHGLAGARQDDRPRGHLFASISGGKSLDRNH